MAGSRSPFAPPSEPAPQRSDSVEIVDAIIAAAVELAGPDVTTNAIAERAGVGVASLYRYFPNREAIFAEISRRLLRRFHRQVGEILADESVSLEDAVRRICTAVVSETGVDREVRRCLNLCVPFSWSKASADEAYGGVMSDVTQWLVEHTEIPKEALAARVFVGFSAIRGALFMFSLYPEHSPPESEIIANLVIGTMAILRGGGDGEGP